MKGLLITNAFLHTNKFTEINLWLIEAAKKQSIELIVKTNAEVLVHLDSMIIEPMQEQSKDPKNEIVIDQHREVRKEHKKEIGIELEYEIDKEKPDFVLFWDKDIRLAQFLEMKGLSVFNSSNGIAICDDKSLTHLHLQSAGIKMPRTILAPMTFSNIGYNNLEFLDEVIKQLNYPMIIKECFGSFGQQVYMAKNKQELEEKVLEIGSKPMLFQEFIQSSNGKDIRLQVVGNQVVAAMYRYSDNGDFRANISNGGKMKSFEPTQEQIDIAIQCCKIIGLDFAGVDILFGENQEPIVCEVNSNAHFKNIFDCTGVNVADYIMEYIIKRLCIG